MIAMTDIFGETQIVTGIKSLTRSKKVNGEKTLQLLVIPTENNASSFDFVDTESRFTFDGDPYIIKEIQEKSIGHTSIKQAAAVHSFFDDMINSFQYSTFSGSQTFFAALTRVFEPTPYDFSIVDSFNEEEFENFGEDNCLSLFNTVLQSYSAEFEIIGMRVYLKKQIGAHTGFQLRWKSNIKAIDKQVDTKNLATYIKGYGKLKEETDMLSGVVIPYASRAGTYYTEPGLNLLATAAVNANFKFSFIGTGFNFDTVLTFLGGLWTFTIDGKTNVQISTYKDVTSEHSIIPIIRGLEHKSHSVVATFKGKDSKNPYTKEKTDPDAIGYLKSGNIIPLYRELVGDERFAVVAEYTSPNADNYPNPNSADGLRHAEPISDERITTHAAMLEKIKKILQDAPQLSITTDIAQIDGTVKNEGDFGYIIYEPMNVKLEGRVVEITETFNYISRKWKVMKTAVTLDNLRNKLTDITTRFAQTSKRIDRLFEGRERLSIDVLPEAIRLAAEAINNSMTQVEYPPNQGIVLRDPDDPNIMVRLTSAGIGLSNDGGVTYRTAMTGLGIVTNELVAGIIRTNNIQIVGEDDLFYWNGEGLFAYNPSDLTRYVRLNSDGLYIAKGALTLERPDGYKVINNGMSVYDVNIQAITLPMFHGPGVVEVQREYSIWMRSRSATSLDYNQYRIKRDNRYLKVRFRLLAGGGAGEDPVNTAYLEIWRNGEVAATASTQVFDEYDPSVLNGSTLTVDMGIPDGQRDTFQIRMRSSVDNANVFALVSEYWLEE